MPDRRTFVLSRAGFAGIQRYAANWMGDNLSRWDHLWLSIPMAMGFGALRASRSSAPTSAASTGTRTPSCSCAGCSTATLTPFCRNHSEIGNVDQYAWAWGEAVARPRARRRSSCATGCCPTSTPRSCARRETGAPVQRPLVFDHQDDPAVRDIDDQYLFGPRPARRAGRRGRARPPARSTCPRATGTTGTPASALDGGRGTCSRRRRWTASRSTPAAGAVIPMWPRGAAVDRRPPPARRSSCTCSSRAATARTARSCRRTTG